MSSEQQATRSSRSSTLSSNSSNGNNWLELTHAPRDTSSANIAATSNVFLTLTASPARQGGQQQGYVMRNTSDEERRLFLLRARNGN